MDYNRLSRESLIHEIEQLYFENERLRMRLLGIEMGVINWLDGVQSELLIVGLDFKVIWANQFATKVHPDILNKKCYQALFDIDDVCNGCKLQFSISNRQTMQHNLTIDQDINNEIRYFPIYDQDLPKGAFVIHEKNHDDQEAIDRLEKHETIYSDYRKLESKYEHLKSLNQYFSKAMSLPLRSFVGYFQAFNEHSHHSVNSDYYEILKHNAQNLYETFNRLLVMTKFESDGLSGRREAFIIRKTLQDILNQVLVQAKESEKASCGYSVAITETLPEVLIGDVFKFRLAVSYLLEFCNDVSGNKPIEVSVSDIFQTRTELMLKLTIHAFNIVKKSLAYYEMDQAFEFERLEDFQSALGLSLSKEIVKSMDGDLDVSIGLDERLYVELKMTFEKVVPIISDEHSAENTGRRRILIADFEKPQLSLDLLKQFDVYFAHNGEEAIKLYFDTDPDLMIVNVLIEDCDGFKVFDEIESRRKDKRPIIAISNKLVDNEREFLRDYGFDEYFSKPLNDDKMQSIINNYI